MSKRISGASFDVFMDSTLVHVEKVTLDITDNTTATQTGGVPDGYVAGGGAQEIIGSTVYIGTGSVNALTMMLETIDLLGQLAQQCASHTHPETGQPTNASAFSGTADAATATRGRYETFIA